MLRPDKKVRDVYRLGDSMGKGFSSAVKKAVCRETGKAYACKIMSLPDPTKGRTEGVGVTQPSEVLDELVALSACDHDCIMKLFEVYEEKKR